MVAKVLVVGYFLQVQQKEPKFVSNEIGNHHETKATILLPTK